MFFYFVLKYEFNFIDALGKASAMTTDQIDVENGERYGIEFTEADGSKKHPYILHLSPSGAIERMIYSLLEKEAIKMKKGEKGRLFASLFLLDQSSNVNWPSIDQFEIIRSGFSFQSGFPGSFS